MTAPETIIPIVISAIALALSVFKYLDKSKEKISNILTEIQLLKLRIEQIDKWGDHVEQNLLGKIEDQKDQAEKLSEKLDEIRDKLND